MHSYSMQFSRRRQDAGRLGPDPVSESEAVLRRSVLIWYNFIAFMLSYSMQFLTDGKTREGKRPDPVSEPEVALRESAEI